MKLKLTCSKTAQGISDERKRHETTLQVALQNSSIVMVKRATDGEYELQSEAVDESEQTDLVPMSIDTVDTDDTAAEDTLSQAAPKAALDPKLQFSLVLDAVRSVDAKVGDNDPPAFFSRQELQVWRLAAALWDPFVTQGNTRELSQAQQTAINAALRREEIGNWLKGAVESSVEDRAKSNGGIDAVFTYLTGRQIGKAVMEAVQIRDFKLATVLSQLGGPGSRVAVQRPGSGRAVRAASGHGVPGRGGTDTHIAAFLDEQVHIWDAIAAKKGVAVGAAYMKVWKLAAGNTARWGADMCSSIDDWKRTFGLFLWYGGGGAWDVREAVRMYEEAFVRSAYVRKPLPGYLEKKGVPDVAETPKDICFHLLKLFSDETHRLEDALRPENFVPAVLDHRIPWLIHSLLWPVKKMRGFMDDKTLDGTAHTVDGETGERRETVCAPGRTAQGITRDLIAQLESIGLWQWAIFVALFLETWEGREASVKELLARWYPVDDNSGSWWGRKEDIKGKGRADQVLDGQESEVWRFLVGTLKVPKIWIHEAKALRAKYDGNVLQEAISLIDTRRYAVAHRIIMTKIAPDAVIGGQHKPVQMLLSRIPTTAVDGWSYGGGLILEYVTATRDVPALIMDIEAPLFPSYLMRHDAASQEARSSAQKTRDEARRELQTWQHRMQKLLDILGKRRREGVLWEQILGVQGRVCISQMASKVTFLIGEVKRVCGDRDGVSGGASIDVPLPEDQRLQNLHKTGPEWFKQQLSLYASQ